ncbi:MAG: AAA family ATPase [Pseudomonadota bacterium]
MTLPETGSDTGSDAGPHTGLEAESGRQATMPAGPLGAVGVDAGIVRVPSGTMAALGLKAGDPIQVSASSTDSASQPQATVPQLCLRVVRGVSGSREIGLDDTARLSLGVALGAPVTVEPAGIPPDAHLVRLEVAGGDSTLPLSAGALAEMLLDRHVTLGETLRAPGHPSHSLRVSGLEPQSPARIAAVSNVTVSAGVGGVGYRGIAGLPDQIRRVREMVELPLRRPDLFSALGLSPPRGVLFTGPPGTGKTLLARCLADECGATFLSVDAPEIVTKHYGESEARLRRVFEDAARKAPAIVFIDEIDALAPRRAAISEDRQLERRLVAQLLTLLDGLGTRGDVVVIGATNMPDALDMALRRPGRFDREIRFDAPDAEARAGILALHLARTPLGPDVDLRATAARAEGYTGADLAALAREACLAAAIRADTDGQDAPEVREGDLLGAFREVGPSVLRDLVTTRPAVRFSDVGGLAEARDALIESFIWPRAHAAAARDLGVEIGRGVLLSGPPGTGKTLLARALAGEIDAPFLVARGPQVLSRYLGDAERALADIFDRARQAAPVVLFFDELDAIAPARGTGEPALQRLVAQLLVEIDGIESSRGIFLLAATNRVEAIDPALLRPGRFDRVIAVGRPSQADRHQILRMKLLGRKTSPDLDLEAVAGTLDGLSGAEIEGVVDLAARAALRRRVQSGVADPVAALSTDDLLGAIEVMGERAKP